MAATADATRDLGMEELLLDTDIIDIPSPIRGATIVKCMLTVGRYLLLLLFITASALNVYALLYMKTNLARAESTMQEAHEFIQVMKELLCNGTKLLTPSQCRRI